MDNLDIAVLGLSITSSWGNGHATTYRALIRELDARGHDVLFLERAAPWYLNNQDMPNPSFCETQLYETPGELRDEYGGRVQDADLVIVGSYVPDGVKVGEWAQSKADGPVAFYDIDTPVTLAKLERGDYEYLSPELIPGYDLYMSFTGGPTLRRLEEEYDAPKARLLACSVDTERYHPISDEASDLNEDHWLLGYLGTYSDDRQPRVESMLNAAARHLPDRDFVVAGPQYPESLEWPSNVERRDHVPPAEHRSFYNAQAWTLNVTRDDMREAGWSPSVRLFEASACRTPCISDRWDGLEEFFTPGEEILVAESTEEVLHHLTETSEEERRTIAQRAYERVLSEHTAADRARQLEEYFREVSSQKAAAE